MLRFLFAALLAAAATAAATSAPARTADTGTFDVAIGGFRAGVLGFSGAEENGRYAASARVVSSGIVALVSDVSYDARATGRVTARGYVPARYEERTNTGERISNAVMAYVNGVPQLKAYDPPEPPGRAGLDPATQGGTLDPMTAIYAILRDMPRESVCTLRVDIFDGKRRSLVTTAGPRPQGEAILCEGEYRRVAGFTEGQMRRKTRFPFRITYTPVGENRYRVTRVVFETLYGRATLDRR